MKNRAGIFDPWRQDAPPKETVDPSGSVPDDIVDPVPDHCVQFQGVKAGINVWLSINDESKLDEVARQRLVDAVYKLHPHAGNAKIFEEWGIHLASGDPPMPVTVVGTATKKITIQTSQTARAIDSLALALRETLNMDSQARDILNALKIRPYLRG